MAQVNLLQKIHSLQGRTERLERELSALRKDLARVAELAADPSQIEASYVIDGETYVVTTDEAEAMQKQLLSPISRTTAYDLVAAEKVAVRLRDRPAEEQQRLLSISIETARADAIADGTAISTEAEAAVGD